MEINVKVQEQSCGIFCIVTHLSDPNKWHKMQFNKNTGHSLKHLFHHLADNFVTECTLNVPPDPGMGAFGMFYTFMLYHFCWEQSAWRGHYEKIKTVLSGFAKVIKNPSWILSSDILPSIKVTDIHMFGPVIIYSWLLTIQTHRYVYEIVDSGSVDLWYYFTARGSWLGVNQGVMMYCPDLMAFWLSNQQLRSLFHIILTSSGSVPMAQHLLSIQRQCRAKRSLQSFDVKEFSETLSDVWSDFPGHHIHVY